MLNEFVGETLVIDLRSEYVCLGTLLGFDDHFLLLKNADIHDLRDTDTTREMYVAEARETGIQRNRKRMVLTRAEIVGLARLEDVTAE